MVELTTIWLGELAFLVAASFLIAIYFLLGVITNRAREQRALRKYYFGFFLFLIFVALAGLVHFLYVFNLHVYGVEIWAGLLGNEQNAYFYFLVTLLHAGFICLNYQIEKHIRQSKHYPFTILETACFGLSLLPYFFPPELNDQVLFHFVFFSLVGFGISLAYWGIYYLRIAAKSAGDVRKRALAVAFGLAFYFAGILLDELFRMAGLPMVFSIIFLATSISGIPLLFVGFQRKFD